MSLSHASSVVIVTWPRKENAVEVSEREFAAVTCIVKALLAQEKEIRVLVAEGNASKWQKFLAKCEAEEIFTKRIPVMSVAMTTSDWSRDVCSAMHKVVDYLGPSFRSTILNSVIFVNEQGNLSVQSSLCLGENLNSNVTSNRDHVMEYDRQMESICWLNPRMVATAAYVLNTCPIHCRYVRRGRGKHIMKTENEFFVTRKQMESLGFEVSDVDE
ncbi:hypothetical protein ACROYT_G042806 [Oculina patagonica]